MVEQWLLSLIKDGWVHFLRLDFQTKLAVVGMIAVLGYLFWPFSARGSKWRWRLPLWAGNTDKKMVRALQDGCGDDTYLGSSNFWQAALLPPQARESHMQIVGPTRSGKSQLLLSIVAQDMARKMPVFFMEAKGDRADFDQFVKASSLTGRLGSVRYFNPQDPRSMTFNPIRIVPGQDPTALANQIARAIGREPTSSGEGQDYYRSVDYAKIQTMAEIFCQTGRQFTLKDCFYYFSYKKARDKAFGFCSDYRLIGMAERGFAQSEDNTALTSAIRPWMTGNLGALLNSYSPQIKLEEVFQGSQLAYFAIPLGHLQVLANPLGRMIISGLLSVASWRQKSHPKPEPATVILDEFAEFATPAFASFIATVGSARLWTILSHQDLGQLKKVQGMDAAAFSSAVYNNTSGCKVAFRTPDPTDAEFWASTLGTYEGFEHTERVQKTFFGERKTGDASKKTVDRYKIHPNLLKNLGAGTAMIFAPGRQDCLAKTARLHRVLGAEVPGLPTLANAPEEGLDLESAVPDAEGTNPADHRGMVKA